MSSRSTRSGATGVCSIAAAALLVLACGSEEAASPVVPAEAASISGMYEVDGVTIDVQSGEKREISGTVILSADRGSYTSTFDLDTAFQTPEGALSADVIGSGSGAVEGRILRGETSTQVIISTVPGVDPGFAFVPRTTTTRIVSETVTTIAADGTVEIEIESKAAEGASDYTPTRTVLRGARVESGVSGIGGGIENPHSAPMEAEGL